MSGRQNQTNSELKTPTNLTDNMFKDDIEDNLNNGIIESGNANLF